MLGVPIQCAPVRPAVITLSTCAIWSWPFMRLSQWLVVDWSSSWLIVQLTDRPAGFKDSSALCYICHLYFTMQHQFKVMVYLYSLVTESIDEITAATASLASKGQLCFWAKFASGLIWILIWRPYLAHVVNEWGALNGGHWMESTEWRD